MNTILLLHSILRFALLLVMIVGILRTIVLLATRATAEKLDNRLASTFVVMFDLQALLGVLVILLGGLVGPLHPLLMFIALVIAHGIESIVKQSGGSTAILLRLMLYVAPLSIVLFSLALIDHLPV